MFRKPKKNSKKSGMRRKRPDNVEEEEHDTAGDDETTRELAEARKRAKTIGHKATSIAAAAATTVSSSSEPKKEESSQLMHHFEANKGPVVSQNELVTSTNQHHPTQTIDRGNKFLAGPIKAPTNIRTTCRFDYQPDVCKDYKDTGFCGFGDTCIYLHDRGDTLSGWQLEQKWQEEQEAKKKKQQEAMDEFMNGGKKKTDGSGGVIDDDGLPFACHLCRLAFTDPVVTTCLHYYCEKCIMKHVQSQSQLCPVCNKDTYGIFHQPTKLLSKKRKLCGSRDATWEAFQEACQNQTASSPPLED